MIFDMYLHKVHNVNRLTKHIDRRIDRLDR